MSQIPKLRSPEFLTAFINLQRDGADLFQLRGNALIIEQLEIEEYQSAGGIVLPTRDDQALGSIKDKETVLGLVLMVGSGVIDEDGDTVKTDIEVGNLILCPKYSVETWSTFPGLAGLAKERLGHVLASEVKFLYRDISSFEKAAELLNRQ